MLFNQPQILVRPPIDGSSDGTYLHDDEVFQTVVKNLTPYTVYADNKELIESFTRTVINYSPISINITDFWAKEELEQVIIPLPGDEGVYDNLPKEKIYDDGVKKAFFINSIIKVQEKLAEQYLNNMYTTALDTRYSHTLRKKLYRIFNSFDIPIDQKNLLFNKINLLFKEERFVTNKEFSMKKGKSINFKYAAISAHDAEIEGPLKSFGFFLNYYSMDNDPTFTHPLSYKIESVLLPDVYRSFVMPLTHPLGMGLQYLKICLQEFTDRVFSTERWTADAVTVKCTNPSNTSPHLPPGVLYPWLNNPDWVDFIDLAPQGTPLQLGPPIVPAVPGYDPFNDGTWIYAPPYDAAPTMSQFLPDLPYPSFKQNDEIIVTDETLLGPWDSNQNPWLPEIIFASKDGLGLAEAIKEIDEGQGNILVDIQTGNGYDEYSWMSYTKYIFENGNYLIEYSCVMENGETKRVIEYYRYDVFDTSIFFNTVASNTVLPRVSYPNIKDVNIVNGIMPINWDPNIPFRITPYGFDDTTTDRQDVNYAEGLDHGAWSPLPSGGFVPSESAPISSPAFTEDTNTFNILPQFTEVYTLISRFIETRKCMVNVYNLQNVIESSLREEFNVNLVYYQDNIVNVEQGTLESTNVMHNPKGSTESVNTANKFQGKRRQ